MAEDAATSSRTNLALGLALGSLVTMVVVGSLDADGLDDRDGHTGSLLPSAARG